MLCKITTYALNGCCKSLVNFRWANGFNVNLEGTVRVVSVCLSVTENFFQVSSKYKEGNFEAEMSKIEGMVIV